MIAFLDVGAPTASVREAPVCERRRHRRLLTMQRRKGALGGSGGRVGERLGCLSSRADRDCTQKGEGGGKLGWDV